MNVVGKVGSLITQGVYSVATPFHPFGGAVDVIVVQQKDGSFRSTPWYVRFGKFQGVLKGAEKIVSVNVNGVKANFNMYLDNSGEAYFVREVNEDKQNDSSEVIDANNSEPMKAISNDERINDDGSFPETRRLEHSISDPGIIQLQVENGPSAAVRIGRASSDAVRIERQESGRRYYEFEDEQTILEGSSELSEYGTLQYGSLDGNEVVESKDSHSEVVLVSVDGHVLTAPVSASDHNKQSVELGTPQFHLGPAESPWDDDYLCNFDASKANAVLDSSCNTKGNDNASQYQQEVCQGEKEHLSPLQESRSLEKTQNEAKDLMRSDSEDFFKMKEVFKSCLALPELENSFHMGDENSSPTGQNSREKSSLSCEVAGGSQQDNLMQLRKTIPNDSNSPNGIKCLDSSAIQEDDQKNLQACDMESCRHSAADNSEFNIDHSAESSPFEVLDGTQEGHAPGDDCCKSELAEPGKVTSIEGGLNHSTTRMGLVAAADAHRVSEEDERPESQNEDNKISPAPAGRRWTLWPIPFRRVKTVEHTRINSSNEEPFVHSESAVQNTSSEPSTSSIVNQASPQKQFIRTNVPTNEDVASLNLKEGQNSVTFSFATRVLGTQQVDAHIYLWKWNAKIVISDVDGTITKSDVLGQFMPLVGKDWSQSGVATLFSAIRENGYQLLFLSARAIVQAYLTKSFLFNLKQDGKTLPTGPVVISPDGLFPSLFREVIRRAPHEFKIACLEDIRKLFPPDYNPFYAGFGNRDTDELSYRKMGIPKGKIFIINPKGEVAISHRIDRAKSYTSLHTLVNDMFPPTCLLVEHEDYNSWNYWKLPLPDID